MEVLIAGLPKIFGIQSFSPVAACEKDMDVMKALAITIMDMFKDEQLTFKVEVNRTDKAFPLESHAIQREIGGHVLPQYQNLSVKVKKPDVEFV